MNEEDLATFLIGTGVAIDVKAKAPKIDGMTKELWDNILRLSTAER